MSDADLAASLQAASGIEVHTVGRQSGRPHRVVVWFAYADGAVHILAHARDHRRGTDWYQNLMAAGQATLVVAGHRATAVPAPLPPDIDPYRYVVALMEAKYGAGAIGSWYDPALRIPVRLVILDDPPLAARQVAGVGDLLGHPGRPDQPTPEVRRVEVAAGRLDHLVEGDLVGQLVPLGPGAHEPAMAQFKGGETGQRHGVLPVQRRGSLDDGAGLRELRLGRAVRGEQLELGQHRVDELRRLARQHPGSDHECAAVRVRIDAGQAPYH